MIHKNIVRFAATCNVFTVDSQPYEVLFICVSSEGSDLHQKNNLQIRNRRSTSNLTLRKIHPVIKLVVTCLDVIRLIKVKGSLTYRAVVLDIPKPESAVCRCRS